LDEKSIFNHRHVCVEYLESERQINV
jgi:hypothetical protein